MGGAHGGAPSGGPPMGVPGGGDIFLTSKKGVGVRACGAFSGLSFAFLNFLFNQFSKKVPFSIFLLILGPRGPGATMAILVQRRHPVETLFF